MHPNYFKVFGRSFNRITGKSASVATITIYTLDRFVIPILVLLTKLASHVGSSPGILGRIEMITYTGKSHRYPTSWRKISLPIFSVRQKPWKWSATDVIPAIIPTLLVTSLTPCFLV